MQQKKFKPGDLVIVNHEDFIDKRKNFTIEEKPYRVIDCHPNGLLVIEVAGRTVYAGARCFRLHKTQILKEILDNTA